MNLVFTTCQEMCGNGVVTDMAITHPLRKGILPGPTLALSA